MTPKEALDEIVLSLRQIDTPLSGDDSPFADPWEEIKDQVQHGFSFYWPVYRDTIKQVLAGYVAVCLMPMEARWLNR